MRRGVQFGPELTAAEKSSGKTQHSRGLLFTCYQTSITNGFQFIQQCEIYSLIHLFLILRTLLAWANTKGFPPFTGKPFDAGYVIKSLLADLFDL